LNRGNLNDHKAGLVGKGGKGDWGEARKAWPLSPQMGTDFQGGGFLVRGVDSALFATERSLPVDERKGYQWFEFGGQSQESRPIA